MGYTNAAPSRTARQPEIQRSSSSTTLKRAVQWIRPIRHLTPRDNKIYPNENPHKDFTNMHTSVTTSKSAVVCENSGQRYESLFEGIKSRQETD